MADTSVGEQIPFEHVLRDRHLPTPCLVMDLEQVRRQYRRLAQALPGVTLYYAVKANPMPEILNALHAMGAHFDIASVEELECCLELGIPVERISFGNTIKKASAIRRARELGVRVFACDSLEELAKIGKNAPGACVAVRLLTAGAGADWPLSRKFGCDTELAFAILVQAKRLGLGAHSIAFHVGSQQTDPKQWEPPIAAAAGLLARLREQGIEVEALNLGGGFPARYLKPAGGRAAEIEDYGTEIARLVKRYFGTEAPALLAEPGRYLVAEAGVVCSEVVLVTDKAFAGDARWVYLDCGKFGGLAETMGEAIKYPIEAPGRSGPPRRVVLAGPTCDSADVLYENTAYYLPADLRDGDRVLIRSAGAYTHTYSAVGFNGFPPMTAICV